MGFLAAAAPIIGKVGGALLGGLLGKKSQDSAQKRSPEEAAALQGAQTSANNLTQQGQTLTQAGLPSVRQGLGYYSTLLGGNRAAMSMATAAPRAAITSQYRGAERGLEHSGVRGAVKDLASAELGRDRAGQVAGLTAGVQPGAAAGLMAGGTPLIGMGTSTMSGAGSIWSRLLGEGADNRQYARGEGEKAGKSIGGLIFDLASAPWGKIFHRGGGDPNLPGGNKGPY